MKKNYKEIKVNNWYENLSLLYVIKQDIKTDNKKRHKQLTLKEKKQLRINKLHSSERMDKVTEWY